MGSASDSDKSNLVVFLRKNPIVEDVALVTLEGVENEAQEGVACVVIKSEFRRTLLDACETDRVSSWSYFFEQVYRESWECEDPSLDTTGWLNNYTDKPYETAVMNDWVEDSLNQLIDFAPKHVLEIGCGSGMILCRLAKYCETYVGTDLAKASLNNLERVIAGDAGLSHVSLLNRRADDFEGFGDEQFDLIVLNSVIQYFPSGAYLESVIEGALRCLKKGGHLFLGDIRSRRLFRTFYADTFSAINREPGMTLLEAINFHMGCQHELLFDPSFVGQLQQRFPDFCEAKVRLERGKLETEMNRFRYHVSLRKGVAEAVPDCESITCQGWGLAQIRQQLLAQEPERILLKGIINQRLVRSRENEYKVFGLEPSSQGAAVCPEALHDLAATLGYRVELGPSLEGLDDMDALFARDNLPMALPVADKARLSLPLGAYATQPLDDQIMDLMISVMRRGLDVDGFEGKQPLRFLLMRRLPKLPSGAVDVQVLTEIVKTQRKVVSRFSLAGLEDTGPILSMSLQGIFKELFLDLEEDVNDPEAVRCLVDLILEGFGVELEPEEVLGKRFIDLVEWLESKLV